MEKHILLLFGYARDRLFNEQTDFIRALPEKHVICCAGKRILCAHGSPRRINEPVGPMSSEGELKAMTEDMLADVLLCGHTHRPFETCVNGKRIINAGGVSLCAKPSMGILEIEGGARRFIPLPVEYDVVAMLRDAAVKGFPGGDGYAAKFG